MHALPAKSSRCTPFPLANTLNGIDTYIGICGQASSDFPELAQYLIDIGINSVSLTPDTVIPFLMRYLY